MKIGLCFIFMSDTNRLYQSFYVPGLWDRAQNFKWLSQRQRQRRRLVMEIENERMLHGLQLARYCLIVWN